MTTPPARGFASKPIGIPIAIAIFVFGLLSTIALFEPTANGIAAVRRNVGEIVTIVSQSPRNLDSIIPGVLLLTSSWWIGRTVLTILRIPLERALTRTAVAFSVGLATWNLIAFVASAFHALYGPLFWSLSTTGTFLAIRLAFVDYDRFRDGGGRFARPRDMISLFLIATTLVECWIALLGALEPEVQFDARRYHLAEALHLWQHHGLYDLVKSEHLFYSGFSNYQEIMYAVGWSMGDMISAKVLTWISGVLATFIVFALVDTMWRSERAALLAAALFAGTPIVSWSMTTASTDLPSVPYSLVALFAISRYGIDGNVRWLGLAGGLIGVALGIKATGLEIFFISIAVVVTIALVSAKAARITLPRVLLQRVGTPILVLLATTLLTAAGWFVESGITTHDPIFPLAIHVFHTPFTSPSVDAASAGAMTAFGADTGFFGVFTSPFHLTFDVDKYRDIIGSVYFVGLPMVIAALCFGRWKDRTFVASLAVVITATFLMYAAGTVEVRYIEWALAVTAALIAVAADDLARAVSLPRVLRFAGIAISVLAIVASNQLLLPLHRYAEKPQLMGSIYLNWDYLYHDLPEEAIQLQYAPMIRYMNASLSAEARVFDIADLMLFNAYSVVELYNGSGYDSITAIEGWGIGSQNAYEKLESLAITHLVTFRSARKTLRRSALAKHLVLLHREPRSGIYASDDFATDLYALR